MTQETRAQKVREELFERYDQLTALWKQAEERLTRYHIPHTIQFDYVTRDIEQGNPNSGWESDCLGLLRIKGSWRICHGSYRYFQADGPENWTPILDCSVEDRVAAAGHLPGLENKIIESSERFIPRVDKAIESLKAALKRPDNLPELLAERAKLNGKAK